MKITRAKSLDFPLEISFSDNVKLEVIETTELLGKIRKNKLKYDNNIDYIGQKAGGKYGFQKYETPLSRTKVAYWCNLQRSLIPARTSSACVELKYKLEQCVQMERIRKQSFL